MIHLSPAASWLLIVSLAFICYVAFSLLYQNSLKRELDEVKDDVEWLYRELRKKANREF